MSRTIVITGASDGIGAQAARRLSSDGHRVVLVGRSKEKTRALAAELSAPFFLADYAELDQVRALADSLRRECDRIDVLANNAGGIFGDRSVTVDGFERTFQVNHLAGFLLTHLLMDRLIESDAAIIQTSSLAARRFSAFDIDDLQGERAYSSSDAYGNSKLENILFTKELDRRFRAQGVSAVAFHPGAIRSSFATGAGGAWEFLYTNPIAKLFLTSVEKGGERLVWLAEGTPDVTWVSGEYYEKNEIAKTSPLAADAALASRLWSESEELLGL